MRRQPSVFECLRNPVSWYSAGSGRGIALTTIDGSVSMRVDLPGGDDWRYARYPDGTEELYNITRDPNEHANRVNYATGKGLTAADTAIRATLADLMDHQLAQSGYVLSEGAAKLTGTAADEMFVTTVDPGTNSFAGGAGDDTYVLYRAATIAETVGGGANDMILMRNDGLEAGFTLPANVETIQINGPAVTGNGAANRIIAAPSATGSTAAAATTPCAAPSPPTGWSAAPAGTPSTAARPGTPSPSPRRRIRRKRPPVRSSPSTGRARRSPATGSTCPRSTPTPGLAGTQAFKFGGADAGQVRLVNNGSKTEVLANTDSDSTPEVRIVIEDGATPASAYGAQDLAL